MAWCLLRAAACSLVLACLPVTAAASQTGADPWAESSGLLDEGALELWPPAMGAHLRIEKPVPGPFFFGSSGLVLDLGEELAMPGPVENRRMGRDAAALGAGFGLVLGAASLEMTLFSDAARRERTIEGVLGFLTASDKQLHFFASTALSLSVTSLTGELRWGVLTALLLGLGKEVVWDHLLARGEPSAEDMLANALGVGFACLVTYLGERSRSP